MLLLLCAAFCATALPSTQSLDRPALLLRYVPIRGVTEWPSVHGRTLGKVAAEAQPTTPLEDPRRASF